ncbi:MAG: hypothetical protein V4772_09730 [Pseudomonadota bacterium]
MNSLLSQIVSLISSSSIALDESANTDGVAHNLMERAEAGAGRDPHQSQELRNAAQAYLSVVR